MNMVIPDEGKLLWLYWALVSDGSDFEDFVLDLFSNDYDPDDDSSVADFDVATFTGYAQVAIARSSFGAPALVGHVAYATRGAVPTFNCTGGTLQTVYGWFLRGADSDTVLAAARFNTPRDMIPGAMEAIDPAKVGLKTFA